MADRAARRDALFALASGLGAWALPRPARAGQSLELGLVPHLSPRVLLDLYRPLRRHLQQQLQRDVQLSTARDWAQFHARTLATAYDCVVTPANMARLAQIDAGWQPLVTYTPSIRALLVCARQRPLLQPADLRGGSLAQANAQSLVALRARQWLAGLGLRQGLDYQVVLAPQDDSVGALVARGDCVAAVLSGGELLATPEATRTQLVVVKHIADVPAFVVAAAPHLPVPDCDSLRRAWLALPADAEMGRAFLASIGFSGIELAAPELMASLDPLIDDTRRLFAAS